MIKKYLIETNINLIFMRVFNMYSKKIPFSVISKLLDAFENNKHFNLYNQGSNIRDFINIGCSYYI